MVASAPALQYGSRPTPRTRLIGRETERAAAHAYLLDDAVPLLTLTGPGGVGKTRLALAIAADVAPQFADGVVWVDLAPLTDPKLVVTTVATALGATPDTDQSVMEALLFCLHPKQCLLLLDNCEHLLATVGHLVSTLLASCPALQVLTTSRATLHVRGEQILPIPPLAVPQSGSALPIMREVPAAALFVQRSRAVDPQFVLTEQNAGAVAEICQRLDGLPLAIELAAARSILLSPAALLALLSQRLQVLGTGPRDAPARHQTIQDAIAWSYDLLAPEEQGFFRRLPVFSGGWTLEAAAAVSSLALPDVLARLETLIDQSLVLRRTDADALSPRFTMLETIRAFGLERLSECGEEDDARDRHARWVLELAERVEPLLLGADQQRWFAHLDLEGGNVRSALAWGCESDPELALRLASALSEFWDVRGLCAEGLDW